MSDSILSFEKEHFESPESTEPLFDLSELMSIGKDNEEFVSKMCLMFCQQTPELIREITLMYYAGNLSRMSEIAHKIRPSVFNLNIVSLKEVIKAIEKAGKDNSIVESLPQLLQTAERVINDVVRMMGQKFNW